MKEFSLEMKKEETAVRSKFSEAVNSFGKLSKDKAQR